MTTQRRPRYTGQIRKLGEDHYQVQARFGWDPLTKRYARTRRTIRGTKRDAERVLRSLVAEHEAGAGESENPPFAEVAERYLQSIAARGRKESTLIQYRMNVATHFVRPLGAMPVREIRPRDIEQLIVSWRNAGRAPNTVRRLHKQLKAIFSWAEQMEYLPRNPAARVETPERGVVTLRALSSAEAQDLLEKARATRLYAILWTALATGMRQGELLALQWGDVSLDQGTLTVERTVRYAAGKVMVTSPKTRASRRTVSLSTAAVEVLRDHWTKSGEPPAESLVFPSSVGGYWDAPNLRRAMRSLTDSLGISGVRFHDLRHTAASLMEQAGVPISAIAAQLGHSSAAFTYATYVHPSFAGQAAAAVTMGRVLARNED